MLLAMSQLQLSYETSSKPIRMATSSQHPALLKHPSRVSSPPVMFKTKNTDRPSRVQARDALLL